MTIPGEKLDTALLRTAFASAPIGVTISRDGVTEFANDAYLEMFGYLGHEEEIYGQSLLAMVAPEEKGIVGERVRRRGRQDPTESSYDTVGLRRDGTTFPFHVVVRRMLLGDGPASLAFFLDLSDRKRAEEALRHTNEKLDALVRCSPLPIMLLDPDGRVQVWNAAAETVFGWTEAEALGRHMPIVDADTQDEFHLNLQSAMSDGIQGVPAKRVRRDGTPIELELWAAPVRGAEGDAVGVMALTVDMTTRRRTEQALRQSQQQLRHAQKMEAVGRLAGGVAHDFNNLLTAISGFTDLLGRQVADNQDAMASVKEIQRAIERAAGLTRQLLAFGRQQELRPVVLDLNETVAGMERLLSRLVAPGVELELELDDALGGLLADATQIDQVIVNLVVNASDAIPESGRVTLRTRNVDLDEPLGSARLVVPPGRYVALEVADTGTGMDDAVLAHLFEPFFTTKERGKGTGLGLSTVYGIVTQSGGFMHIESSVGEGSTFRVFFPRVDTSESRDAPAKAPPASGIGVVLVVDDDPVVLRLTANMLRHHGFEVLAGDSASAALSLLEEAGPRIEVLLTDVLMPGVTGPELAERVWAFAPELPVVFMSGYAEPSSFPSHVRDRASGFVAKPFQLDRLVAAVELALRASRARAGTDPHDGHAGHEDAGAGSDSPGKPATSPPAAHPHRR